MLAVKIVKKKRYMVQGFEKKKTVINVTSIQERFEERRTVVKSRFFMEGHEDISKERAKRTTHSHAVCRRVCLFCPLVVSSCYVLFLPSYPLLSLTLCNITPCK